VASIVERKPAWYFSRSAFCITNTTDGDGFEKMDPSPTSGSVKALTRAGRVTTVCKTATQREKGKFSGRAARAEDPRHIRSNYENPKTIYTLSKVVTAHHRPDLSRTDTQVEGAYDIRQTGSVTPLSSGAIF
jgi:hypothetical protein